MRYISNFCFIYSTPSPEGLFQNLSGQELLSWVEIKCDKQKEVYKMTNKPEKKFRAGPITATVWKNTGNKDGKETSYMTVSFERSYMDKEGEWQKTSSLRINDLPKATVVLNKAYEFMVLSNTEKTQEVAC